jgi:hypothetical protein
LIDGGSTDATVQEIEESWPEDAWHLHDYLMAKSPNLSTTVLKQMVLQAIMPDAMVSEVLVANPAATRSSGFINWLQNESGHPLPDYMVDMVMASWDQNSYRDALVGEMALHHGEMTQSADMLIQHYRADTLGTPVDSVLWAWQQLRTVAARYAEALTWLEEGNYAEATAAVDTIPSEHDLKTPDEQERQRMLDLIGFLQGVHADGRTEADLDSSEVATLQTLMGDAYDRPAAWISNLLCFGYGICRPPLTGGEDHGEERSLPYTPSTAAATQAVLDLRPNPATNWATVEYDLKAVPDQAELVVRDATGREVFRTRLSEQRQQVLWDTRQAAPGSYTVVLLNSGHQLRAEKLIVRQ